MTAYNYGYCDESNIHHTKLVDPKQSEMSENELSRLKQIISNTGPDGNAFCDQWITQPTFQMQLKADPLVSTAKKIQNYSYAGAVIGVIAGEVLAGASGANGKTLGFLGFLAGGIFGKIGYKLVELVGTKCSKYSYADFKHVDKRKEEILQQFKEQAYGEIDEAVNKIKGPKP